MYRNFAREGPSQGHMQHTQKFGRVVFELCGRTDRQTTDILITILRTTPGDEVLITWQFTHREIHRDV